MLGKVHRVRSEQKCHGLPADRESRLSEAISAMLTRPDYVIPLAAAESQFRRHYYGLNSAALLEDLFYDALGNFLRQTSPGSRLRRPVTGQKGWDYELDGLKVSHKVSNSISAIGALWDATRTDLVSWSFEEPVVYSLSQTSPGTVRLALEDVDIGCHSISRLDPPFELPSGTILVVRWPPGEEQATLLESIPVHAGSIASDVLPFDRVWSRVSELVREGGSANHLDVLFSRKIVNMREHTGARCTLKVQHRAGVYVLPTDLLQDLPVEFNNRGVLIPRSTVGALLTESMQRSLYSPLPTWFKLFANERPPDMYATQRTEFDALFSARQSTDFSGSEL